MSNTNLRATYLKQIEENPTLRELLDISIKSEGQVFDIANIVYAMFKDSYVNTRTTNKRWFVFRNHYWNETEIGVYNELSTKVIEMFLAYKEFIKKDIVRGDSDKQSSLFNDEKSREKYTLENFRLILYKIIDCLKTVAFKEKICNECKYLFFDDGFLNKLDKNDNLICFANGVLEQDTKTFREGTREDMISIATDSSYYESEDTQNTMQNIISNFAKHRAKVIAKRGKTKSSLIFTFLPNN